MARIFQAVCLLALAAWIQPAVAEQRSGPWEKWSVSLGGFAANLSNDVRVGTPGTGVQVDLEEALGMDSSDTVFRVDGSYRFGESRRHRLDLTCFDRAREATKTLATNIDIDGTIYPIGTTVNSQFDLVFYNARYSYSFIQDDRVDFSGSFGFHVTEIGLGVDAAGIGARGDSTTAPLPLIGGRLDVALTEKWYLRSSAEFMYVEIDNFKGQISDINLAAEYRAWKNFALGAGFNVVRVSLDVDESISGVSFVGSVDSNFSGLLLYGKMMF